MAHWRGGGSAAFGLRQRPSAQRPGDPCSAAGHRRCRGRAGLGGQVGGARRNRRADAGPGLAAAQEAKHAAFDFKFVRRVAELDCRLVELAVLGVVDLPGPLVVLAAFFFMSISSDACPASAAPSSAASGLFLSIPPGVFSQATAPHMLPPHSATRILATPSSTFQSPVGSAANAGVSPAENKTCRKKDSAICESARSNAWALQHVQTYA